MMMERQARQREETARHGTDQIQTLQLEAVGSAPLVAVHVVTDSQHNLTTAAEGVVRTTTKVPIAAQEPAIIKHQNKASKTGIWCDVEHRQLV